MLRFATASRARFLISAAILVGGLGTATARAGDEGGTIQGEVLLTSPTTAVLIGYGQGSFGNFLIVATHDLTFINPVQFLIEGEALLLTRKGLRYGTYSGTGAFALGEDGTPRVEDEITLRVDGPGKKGGTLEIRSATEIGASGEFWPFEAVFEGDLRL